MNKLKVYKILTILLLFQWAFYQLIAQYPSFVETYYSNGIYPIISSTLHFSLGWIPFSFGDLMYLFLAILIIRSLVKTIRQRSWNLKNTFFKATGILSVIYFLLSFGWAINYFRTPVHEDLGFKNSAYSEEELINFTKILIAKVNTVQVLITGNDTLIVKNPDQREKIQQIAFNSYTQLERKYPQFSIKQASIKKSIFSIPLTYMGFTGYLNPFTNEAQLNMLIPKNNYASTACHEIAHQIGIAPENEANFIGYLASVNSKNKYFNYAGNLMALRYCLSNIYKQDIDTFNQLKKTINSGILKDMQQSQDFWKKHQNWSEKYFKIFYDSFLKANKQKEGIKSYHKMVSLLINYHKTTKL